MTEGIIILMHDGVLACSENEKSKAAANPAEEPCDIGVKVADLGNACWTVGYDNGYVLCELTRTKIEQFCIE